MKIFILTCLLAFQFTYAQKNIFSKQLSPEEQSLLNSYFQANYNAKSSASYLLIHYIQPESYCHYNKYNADPEKSVAWFEKFYAENNIIFPDSTKKLFSFQDEKYAAKWKGTPYIFDKGHILHNLITSINKTETCECLLMFSPSGKIIIKYGETTAADFKYILKEITK